MMFLCEVGVRWGFCFCVSFVFVGLCVRLFVIKVVCMFELDVWSW